MREAGVPGYVDDFVAIGEIRGHEVVRAFFGELFAAFPDFTMTVGRVVADDTSAVVQWHAAGTFTGGPFQGIAPTGRRVDADDAKAVVIGEVNEVLDVESYEREIADQAACRDPSVVYRPGTTPPLSSGLQLAPGDRDPLGIWECDYVLPPVR